MSRYFIITTRALIIAENRKKINHKFPESKMTSLSLSDQHAKIQRYLIHNTIKERKVANPHIRGDETIEYVVFLLDK